MNYKVGKLDRDKLDDLSAQLTEVLSNQVSRRQSLPQGVYKTTTPEYPISVYITSANSCSSTSTSQLLSSETLGCTMKPVGAPSFPSLTLSENQSVKTSNSKFEIIKTKLAQNFKNDKIYSNGSSDSEIKSRDKAPKRRKSRSDKKDKVSWKFIGASRWFASQYFDLNKRNFG